MKILMLDTIIGREGESMSNFMLVDQDLKSFFDVADKLVEVDNQAKDKNSVSDSLKCQWR